MSKKLQVIIHVIFWGIILVMPLTMLLSSQKDIDFAWKTHALFSSGFSLVAFYVSFFFLSPLLLKDRTMPRNYLIFLAGGLVIYGIKFGILLKLNSHFEDTFSNAKIISPVFILSDVLNTWLIMVIALLIKISINWFRDQKLKSDLQYQQQTQELALLKAQVNPHFFFNTLNNIYSLVYKKSDDAPAAVLKLSEIMRYMLYDSKTDTVPLLRELEHLENYLELEKLRLRDTNYISYQVEGDAGRIMIPPMLLISFVENAFKHGKKRVKNPGITIRIEASGTSLRFIVANYTLGRQPDDNGSGGIGLQNISRRLELLYPDCHSLDIVNDSDQYIVNLELNCNPIQIK